MAASARLLGDDPTIAALREQIARIPRRQAGSARRQPPVLILGETGTGKGLVASTLHRTGPRASGPFVDVNCAAIPETLLEAELFGYERGAFTDARQAKTGLLQAAHGGTIFLDEVGLLPPALQAKLLKALEEQRVRRLGSTRSDPINVWVLAATSEDLGEAIRARRFREDLYHRLAVVTLQLPPLRERGADVEMLAAHFLAQACEDYGLPPRTLSSDARVAIAGYGWPGNVRELANVMERAALLGEGRVVTADTLALPEEAPRAVPRRGPVAGLPPDRHLEAERATLEAALAATGWNITRAAARLGVPRNTLRYRIAVHGLAASPARRRGGRPPSAARAPGDTTSARPRTASPPTETIDLGARWESRRLTLLKAALLTQGADRYSADATRALETVLDKVRAFGGSLEELGATTVVAVFGVDAAGDAPRRAAHAAAAVQKALARARADDPTRPQATVALHTDRCLVANVGGASRLDGEERRHLESTLEALAARGAPGTVVVSAGAASFLARRFALEALGPDTAPVAYRLVDHDPDRGRTPFVGRESELRLLVERFAQAQAGHGQLVLLAGEAGIGKSRLLRELRRRLAGEAVWVEGRALSGGRTMPMHPLIDMVRRAFEIDEADADVAVVGKLERAVHNLGEDLRPALPFLRDLLSVHPGDPAVARMAPAQRRSETLAALQRILVRAAERRPLIVVVEDVHWADPATEEWLVTLADSLATRRILLILPYRPGWTPALGDRTFHARLALPTLSAAESIRMTRDLLGSETLPDALQALVVHKAEGNPFFVEELVRSLLEIGAVRREGDRLVLTRSLDEVRVPDTIEDVILARIERLEAAPRRLLQVAAVLGKDVPLPLLETVAAVGGDTLRATLGQLQAAEFLYEAGGVTDPELTFKHALTHEVAYECLAADQRRALHRHAGEAIEARHHDRLADVAAALAEHFERGESWRKAATYHLLAAERAKVRYAYPTAARACERAIEAAGRGDPAGEQGRRALVLRGDLSSLLGDMEAANASYDRALTTSSDAVERRRIANRRHRPSVVARDGGRLAFYEHGSGHETLLFVNPILYGLATFQPVIELLCQEFRVITMEPRGTGRSDPLPPDYTCMDHAADVRAVLEATRAAPCVGVGISRGGNVLAHLASHDATALSRLVTVGTRRNPGLLYGGDAEWVTAFRRDLEAGDIETATRLYSRLIFSEPGTVDLAEQFVRNCVALAPAVVRTFFSRDPTSDITEILGRVPVPTLVTIGALDTITTMDEARAMAAALPGAALHVFPGQGHLPVFTAPEDFCLALRRFAGADTTPG